MMMVILVMLTTVWCASARDLTELGYLDVTTEGADPTGKRDSTVALQAAINKARDHELACFFPLGTYLVSDTLFAQTVPERPDAPKHHEEKSCVLIGSTARVGERATIVLVPNAAPFQDATKPRPVVKFINHYNDPQPAPEVRAASRDGGQTRHYHQAFVGIDIRVSSGNPGAIGLRMQGAEGSLIEDTTIDLSASGQVCIWGVPGSGGSSHNLRVIGGEIGIDTRTFPDRSGVGQQPTATISGTTFIDQRLYALASKVRGPTVLVGCMIRTEKTGPIIRLSRHWEKQPFDGSLALIDTSIAYSKPSADNIVLEMEDEYSRSFYLDNVYLQNATRVWHNDAKVTPNGWSHVQRLAVQVKPQSFAIHGETRSFDEQPRVNNKPVGDVLCVLGEAGVMPPDDLQSRHQWPVDFPTYETPGAVNVKDFGAIGDGKTDDTAAIRKAIDSGEVVFFPRGRYVISDTLDLKPNSKLIGVHHSFSQVLGRDTIQAPFGGNTNAENVSLPMIRTADDANAQTYLSRLWIRMGKSKAPHDPTTVGHYAIEWRAGGKSIVRGCGIIPYAPFPYNPIKVAQDLSGNDEVDAMYPQNAVKNGTIFSVRHPIIQIRGNGGGKWFNNWVHGGQMLRSNALVFLIENTTQPLAFYHLHLQQQESDYHAAFRNAQNFSIYGIKSELKAGVIDFENCRNFRVIGYGGMGTPDPGQGHDHLFRFGNCNDFLISNIGEDVSPLADRWIGAPGYKWLTAQLGTYSAIAMEHNDNRIKTDPWARPIVFIQGDPQVRTK